MRVVGGGQDSIDGHRATTVAIKVTAVTVGRDGHLYVTSGETANQEAGVARLNDDGTLTLVINTTKLPHVKTPNGIAVAADGAIYLADKNNNAVHHFTPDGKPFGSEEFLNPTALAITDDDTRYVAADDGVTEIRPDGTRRSAADGPVTNLATDVHGNLFLAQGTDDGADIIVVVRPNEVSTFSWTWIWLGATAVVVAGLITGLLVIRRKRRHPSGATQRSRVVLPNPSGCDHAAHAATTPTSLRCPPIGENTVGAAGSGPVEGSGPPGS